MAKAKKAEENVVKVAAITPFTILSYLTDKKKPWQDLSVEERKAFNPWLINRFLSMDMDYVDLINSIQNQKTEDEHYYKLLLDVLPKRRFFAPYIKSKNAKVWSQDIIDLAAEYLCLSPQNISQALTTLKETDQLHEFLLMFGKTDKEIEKLLKAK